MSLVGPEVRKVTAHSWLFNKDEPRNMCCILSLRLWTDPHTDAGSLLIES
jgi:hypothetical protein